MLLFRSNLHSQIPPALYLQLHRCCWFSSFSTFPLIRKVFHDPVFHTLWFSQTQCNFNFSTLFFSLPKVTARIPPATAAALVKMRPAFAISVGWVPTAKGEMKPCISVFLTALATESLTPTLANASVIPSGRAVNATSVSCQNSHFEGRRGRSSVRQATLTALAWRYLNISRLVLC